MPSVELASPTISLTEDEVEDFLYCARAGELEDLKTSAVASSKRNHTTISEILAFIADETSGNTCLHYAAANGHQELVIFLIASTGERHESVVLKTNAAGNTALHYAALNGQLDVAKQLISSLPESSRSQYVSRKNNIGHDAAYEAEGNGMEDVVTYLLQIMDEADATAARSGEVAREDEIMGGVEDVEEIASDMEVINIENGEE